MWSSRRERFRLDRSRGVDSHDIAGLRRQGRRTSVLRTLAVGAAAALLLAAAASARSLEPREPGVLPAGTVGVVVIDLSLSITEDDYHRVRSVLRRLGEEEARIGLVFFSDVPYELLPPGTPAAELQPMLRLLVPPRLGQPVNPWAGVFRAGTRISPALRLARDMLVRDGVQNGSILLVSDLETAPDDVPALARTLEEIRRSAITLRVSALAPSSDARLLFEDFVEDGAFSLPSDPTVGGEPRTRTGAGAALPTALLALGALFFVALAAHEWVAARLALPVPRQGRSPA